MQLTLAIFDNHGKVPNKLKNEMFGTECNSGSLLFMDELLVVNEKTRGVGTALL